MRLALSTVFLAGCMTPISGGGFIGSAGSGGKAHFAFDLTCDSSSFLVGSWVDHDDDPGGAFTAIHVGGTLTDATGESCAAAPPAGEKTVGDIPYTVQGSCVGDCTGVADLVVIDGGHGGHSKGDYFGIAIISGPYAGYSNGPEPTPLPVLGGNLKLG